MCVEMGVIANVESAGPAPWPCVCFWSMTLAVQRGEERRHVQMCKSLVVRFTGGRCDIHVSQVAFYYYEVMQFHMLPAGEPQWFGLM